MGNRRAYIGLGSNLGDREGTLMRAVAALDASEQIEVQAYSALYESEPVGGPAGQGLYLNGVVEIATGLEPQPLLERLGHIESCLGRDRGNEQRWGPRTCDLDLLLMDEVIVNTPQLTVPHPRMHLRWFVLAPLVEIAPQARHPLLGKTARQMLDDLGRQEPAQP